MAKRVHIGTIASRLSAILNDDHGGEQRWLDADRLQALNEAIAAVVRDEPRLFAESITIPLVPGGRQTIPDGYGELLSIDANVGGDVISTPSDPTEGVDRFVRATANLSLKCGADSAYAGVAEARISDTDGRVFYIEPPAPEGVNASVIATVVKPPPHINSLTSTTKIPAAAVPLLMEWMLYRLYSYEDNSEFAIIKANGHRDTYFALVNKNREGRVLEDLDRDAVPVYMRQR